MNEIFDQLAREMGYSDYDDMVVETSMPFVLAGLELMLEGEGS